MNPTTCFSRPEQSRIRWSRWRRTGRSRLPLVSRRCVAAILFFSVATILCPLLRAAAPAEDAARRILDAADASGGLVIHLGCGDGRLTAALRADESYLVHGLDRSQGNVAEARDYIQSKGLHGPVSVARLSGDKLPYVDNLAKTIVADASCEISGEEIRRVLSPLGVALIERSDGQWDRITAKWPEGIDEWTHYLYDSSNNAVAADTRVGPPRHVQWTGGPAWTRNHHKLNSLSAAVTAGGRLFYIFDEATASDMRVPGKWSVICRDAFSGVKLWQKPLKSWAAARNIRFRSGPPQLPRLMVASGDCLYLPLGLNEPVSALDAATGEVLKTFQQTERAEEILIRGDNLVVVKGSPVVEHAFNHGQYKQQYAHPNTKMVTVVVDTNSGEQLWTSDAAPNIQPLTLAADEENVYYQAGEGVVCRDLKSGRIAWNYGDTEKKRGRKKVSFGVHTLVVADDVVLCNLAGTVHAISTDKGEKLWEQEADQVGFHEPLDIFVIDGLVWLGCNRPDSGSRPAPPAVDDFNTGLDLHSGTPKMKNSILAELQTVGHHHRCYREKATTRYIIAAKRGVEMMDLKGSNHSRNNWVRSSCQYGVLPANGLMYNAPHSCGCYMESKLRGFWATSADRDAVDPRPDNERLTKGPAYGTIKAFQSRPAECWPTYRHDALRTGVAETTVPQELETSWSTELGGVLTQPVVAGGKVILSAVDEDTVYALDEDTGEVAWTFACGGTVDSPPTIRGDAVLFGSADGRVYCLRLRDGQPAWTFLAAPADLRCGGHDRLESVWPAHGSVLVLDGIAYCSAGRSTWLDGGISLYGLDPATGEIRCQTRFDTPHPEYGKGKEKAGSQYRKQYDQNSTDYKTFLQSDQSDAFSMAGGTVSDVLVSDGENIFLHHVAFDNTLKRRERMFRHLFSTSSLLDDKENHRSHWVLGTGDFSRVPVAYSWIVNSGGGRRRGLGIAVPYGVILTYGQTGVWGVHRKGRADGRYVLFERENKALSQEDESLPDFRDLGKDEGPYPYRWRRNLSARPRAVVKSDARLFLATMPTEIPSDDPHAAYEGRLGGAIAVFDAGDGEELARIKLNAPVVWDGMAAANGKLFAATSDGKLLCFAGQ
ncbi:MAG: PQQ-binding-like beta-propeller repeat protein [Planctomycetota bacterium]